MSFYDYSSITNLLRPLLQRKKEKSASEFELINAALDEPFDTRKVIVPAMLIEGLWHTLSRPYYDVYPSVFNAFTKTNFDKVAVSSIQLPLPALLLRCPRNNQLTMYGHELRALLVCDNLAMEAHASAMGFDITTKQENPRHLLIVPDIGEPLRVREDRRTLPIQLMRFVLDTTETIESQLATLISPERRAEDISRFGDAAKDDAAIAGAKILRLILTLCLLGNNPDLIEPLVLNADAAKFATTQDPALIEKALAKGKRGWAIGRHIETAAGFRRPHFGIRWTGVGRVTPKLVPIKGCIVRRKAITDIPTGYLDEVQADLNSNEKQGITS